ncbi:chromate efflux transporter [Termitidicoccus mucosus]|uniref:Chromate transporter n=1 Tax=Termitidicoccus mucosus TaxID=1184151 RepID=A0A178IKJ3_9BACT|nr:chromate transporter [Opitutaceae bacterium TSB47]
MNHPSRNARALVEIVTVFLKLGCISFGGPVAHLAYLHEEFVRKRRWLDDGAYGDLVALCQFLPGPASSQLVYALGMMRGGLPGALLASFCFTLPSALLMILFGYGIARAGDLRGAGWLHGLKLAAVAVVAQAVWNMGKKLCPDRTRVALALLAAVAVLVVPGAWAQIAVIAAGMAAGWIFCREPKGTRTPGEGNGAIIYPKYGYICAIGALVLFALLLLPPLAGGGTVGSGARVFEGFYRAGALVFGGGHVVLPLLHAEVVPAGLVSDDMFLAGYGAAQALPGPLFTFAAYLGTVMDGGTRGWVNGLWCLLAVFLPGWLLIGGALPFWHVLRDKGWMQAAMRGANAAVVGMLLAALYHPVWTSAAGGLREAAAALAAFALLEVWRVPPWCVVLLSALAGWWLFG